MDKREKTKIYHLCYKRFILMVLLLLLVFVTYFLLSADTSGGEWYLFNFFCICVRDSFSYIN